MTTARENEMSTHTPGPHEIAKALLYDLGIKHGIRYAERIAAYATNNQFKVDYAEAAEILRQWSATS